MKFQKVGGQGNEYLYYPIRGDGTISDILWVRRAKSGKRRITESLDTNNKPEARRKRDQIFELWLGLASKPKERILLETIQKHLLDQKKSMVRHSTYKQMEYVWKGMEWYFGGLFIDELNSNHWKNFCAQVRAKYPDRKLFNYYKHLTRIINYASGSGLIPLKVKLEVPKDTKPDSKVYSPSEIDRLLKHADPIYMKFMIPMALELGMRTHEITQLPKDFIDLKEKVIRLPASYTKTGEARVIPLGHLYPLVKEKVLATSTEATHLFPSRVDPLKPIVRDGHKKAWNACRKAAGVEGRFYDLRHTCATKMAKTMQPALAAKILGHDLKVFFKIYCKPTDQDLKDEFRKMSEDKASMDGLAES